VQVLVYNIRSGIMGNETRFNIEQRKEEIMRGKQFVNRQRCMVVVSLLWATFGIEAFSQKEYTDNCESTTIDPESEGVTPNLNAMIDRGFIIREGDFFRLSDDQVRRLLQ